jgi:hypothetical protein
MYPVLILRTTSFCCPALNHTASLLLPLILNNFYARLYETRNALIPFFALTFKKMKKKKMKA